MGWKWISSGVFLLILSRVIQISAPHSALPLQSSDQRSHYQTRSPSRPKPTSPSAPAAKGASSAPDPLGAELAG